MGTIACHSKHREASLRIMCVSCRQTSMNWISRLFVCLFVCTLSFNKSRETRFYLKEVRKPVVHLYDEMKCDFDTKTKKRKMHVHRIEYLYGQVLDTIRSCTISYCFASGSLADESCAAGSQDTVLLFTT